MRNIEKSSFGILKRDIQENAKKKLGLDYGCQFVQDNKIVSIL